MLATLETGKEAFVSRINASIKQANGSIQDRAGVWAALIEDGSLRVEDEGRLYLGRTVRPALRIRYLDISAPKPAQAIAVLSFESEGERAAVQETLQGIGRQTTQA